MMKKRIFSLVFLVGIVTMSGFFIGCGKADLERPPVPSDLVMIDGALTWGEVAIADGYNVYAGNTKINGTESPRNTTVFV
ncbi:MAG: hypothetical protein FWD76_02720, partial [Firmicutes bacterium]|nr:hypothetical protein [Bacillota bacterium]